MVRHTAKRRLPDEMLPVMEQGILNLALDGLFVGPAATQALRDKDRINSAYDQWVKEFWGG